MGYYRWFWCLWAFKLATVGYDEPLSATHAPALQHFGEQNTTNITSNDDLQSVPNKCKIIFDKQHDNCCSANQLKSYWHTSAQEISLITPSCGKRRHIMWQRSPKTLGDTAADAKQQRNQPQPNPAHRGCKIFNGWRNGQRSFEKSFG